MEYELNERVAIVTGTADHTPRRCHASPAAAIDPEISMKHVFRSLMVRVSVALCAAALASTAIAQAYPSRPVRLILPYSPGSGTDVMARVLATELQKELKGSVFIDNRPGANGVIAAEQLAHAPADGYTLGIGTISPHSANPWLIKNLSYRPIDDFTPVARIINFPFYLAVSGTSPIRNLDQFLAAARSGKTRMAMGYGNAVGQVAGARLMKAGGFEAVSVPYKSTPPALVDMLGGQIDFMFVDIASSESLVKDGRVRPIAMMSDQRSRLMPELPALGEKLPGFNFVAWGGLMGPAGLPDAVVQKLQAATLKILASPEIQQRFASLGLEAYPAPAAEFRTFMQDQLRVWGASIQQAGMQPE